LPNATNDISHGLPPLEQPREWIVGFMRGQRSVLKLGYTHTDATLACLDFCELRQVQVSDAERLLLPCFALGVARGLGSETATLELLARLPGGDDEDAIEAYNSGMVYGSWELRLGDTQPATG
jgi:hypothetical protein